MAIREIQDRESLMLIGIGKGGGMTKEQITDLNIPARRLGEYVKAGYVEKKKEAVKDENGKVSMKTWYTLGKEGRDYLKDNGYCRAFAKAQSIEHCPKSAGIVIEKVQSGIHPSKILNEEEQKKHFRHEINSAKVHEIEFSVVDIAIIQEEIIDYETVETVEFIEVITESYRKRDIELKMNYVKEVIAVRNTITKVEMVRADGK